eukprot:6368631-Prymnesium_polylepis.1
MPAVSAVSAALSPRLARVAAAGAAVDRAWSHAATPHECAARGSLPGEGTFTGGGRGTPLQASSTPTPPPTPPPPPPHTMLAPAAPPPPPPLLPLPPLPPLPPATPLHAP